MENPANQITIRGSLLELPQLSHTNHGSPFYRFSLEVPRLSGALDLLPVIVREEILNRLDLSGGEMLTVQGQIRSFNNHSPTGRRLQIFVFAESLTAGPGEPCNQVLVSGTVCKLPVYRRTPLGREITDVMLAVSRSYRRADYLPCILWGRTAQEAARCVLGDTLCIQGRLQSRDYRKVTEAGTEIRTTYEISALTAQIGSITEA